MRCDLTREMSSRFGKAMRTVRDPADHRLTSFRFGHASLRRGYPIGILLLLAMDLRGYFLDCLTNPLSPSGPIDE
jgi:hypothetical protein